MKLNFALIGCGRIAKKHIKILRELEETNIIAVCDIKEDRAKAFSEEYNIPYYLNYKEMLSKESVDVADICTQSGTHAQIAIEVAKMKVDILTEKPMALRLLDADEMIKACDENRVKLFVVQQNRYNLPVIKLRKALEAGRFGKIFLGNVRVHWSRNQDYYDMDGWRGTWAMDGGVLTNQASHHIDLLQWMLGPVESVMAMTGTMLHTIETEDTGVAIFRFKSGALGVVEATTCIRPKDLEGSLSVYGDKGSVEIGGFAVNEMKTWQFSIPLAEDEEILSKYHTNPPNIYGFGHIEVIKNVVDCIVNDKQALVDGIEGRKSLELINAIYESAETGREVFLHFRPKMCRLGEKSTK